MQVLSMVDDVILNFDKDVQLHKQLHLLLWVPTTFEGPQKM